MDPSKQPSSQPPPYYGNTAAEGESLPPNVPAKTLKEGEFPPPYNMQVPFHATEPQLHQTSLYAYDQPSPPTQYAPTPIHPQTNAQQMTTQQPYIPMQQQYGQQQMYGQQPQPYENPMNPQQAQQYPGYGQQVTYVYAQQPMPLTEPPKDYMGYSIFVTICCCWIVGIFAILKSSECRRAVANRDYLLAHAKSREARGMAHLALGLGIAAILVGGVIAGINVALTLGRYN